MQLRRAQLILLFYVPLLMVHNWASALRGSNKPDYSRIRPSCSLDTCAHWASRNPLIAAASISKAVSILIATDCIQLPIADSKMSVTGTPGGGERLYGSPSVHTRLPCKGTSQKSLALQNEFFRQRFCSFPADCLGLANNKCTCTSICYSTGKSDILSCHGSLSFVRTLIFRFKFLANHIRSVGFCGARIRRYYLLLRVRIFCSSMILLLLTDLDSEASKNGNKSIRALAKGKNSWISSGIRDGAEGKYFIF